MKVFTQGEKSTQISGEVKILGKDIVLHLYGGTEPHVGSVAIGISGPSLKDSSKNNATISIYTIVGHKDDILAWKAAQRLTKALGKNTVVIAGFHLDNINTKQIDQVVQNCNLLLDNIINYYSSL